MAQSKNNNYHVVSFDSESLIRVDHDDNEVGFITKADAHVGHGVLHRAFSIFIFDFHGRLLLQQRSADKPLWPMCWSNSCCSHPRRGETMETATQRRLREELGISPDLRFLYKFIYQADYGDKGAEHELCWVYIGRSNQRVQTNQAEIASWRFASVEEVSSELQIRPELYTPWFKLEWARLMDQHRIDIENLVPDRRQV
ncbi:MAG: isopentenyl-diphosphate Delta-isomerase [Wenzhouxiangella sp.]